MGATADGWESRQIPGGDPCRAQHPPARGCLFQRYVCSPGEGVIQRESFFHPAFPSSLATGQWATRFDPKLTKPQDFHLDEGRSTRVPMMSAPRAILKYGFDSELNCKVSDQEGGCGHNWGNVAAWGLNWPRCPSPQQPWDKREALCFLSSANSCILGTAACPNDIWSLGTRPAAEPLPHWEACPCKGHQLPSPN